MLQAVNDSRSTIRNDIAAALRETTGRALSFTDQTNITTDLDLDSLAVMNFVMALEDRYDISIPLDRIAEVRTIGDLIVVVEALRAGTPA